MKRRTKIIIGIGCLVLIVGAISMRQWIARGPQGPSFICHRNLVASMDQWAMATSNGDWYPNINGSGIDSLNVLAPYIYKIEGLRDYRYVPGLKNNDPEALILIYLNEPSRKTWHGDNRWFLRNKRWIIINARTSSPGHTGGDDWSEVGEAITTPEFRKRLKLTLDYLEKSNRPHWQMIRQEHTAFLNSIKNSDSSSRYGR